MRIRTSVIVPSYAARQTLGRVLDALAGELAEGGREVVLVDSSGDGTAAWVREGWPWARVLSLPGRTLPGRARNLGVEAAQGELLAFLDADAVPRPGWLSALERSLDDGADMVAGVVENGTPGSAWGTAGYLLEFLDWAPGRTRAVPHAVSANLLVRRSALAAAGGFREDLWPGEDTVLTFWAARRGRLRFAPEARVLHLNRTRRREVLRHQRRLGAAFVPVCAAVPLGGHRLAHPALAPLATLARAGALLLRARGRPAVRRELVRHGPRLLAGLAAWGAGVAGARSGA